MKSATNFRRLLLLGAASIALVACSDTDISSPGATTPPPSPPPPPPPPQGADVDLVPDGFDDSHPNVEVVEVTGPNGTTLEVAQVTGTVTEDITLTADATWYLGDIVVIGEDGATNPTATIEPGTEILGDGPESGFYVARGHQVIADGTVDAPIVFTSLNEKLRQEGLLEADPNARAEWLGLVINGFAPINNCNVDGATPGTADCEDDGEASSGTYGGGDPEDNSGILNYVRVEHAGVFFTEEDQSNGIAFQAVGSGTQVSNIQVHNNGDDGVEFFGGTVSATNVALTGISDDSVDWTDGWTGSLQNILVLQSDDAADYAIEADNRSVADADLEPRSNPKISNFTFIGNSGEDAIRLREGTGTTLANGIVFGFDDGLKFGDEPTADNLVTDGLITIASHFFNVEDNPIEPLVDDQGTEDEADDVTIYTAAEIAAATQDVETNSPRASATFVPGPEVGAIPVFDVNGIGELQNLGYIGAFAPSDTVADNWAAGWTKPGTVFTEDAQPAAECPSSGSPADYTIEQDGQLDGKIVCSVSGTITVDTTLGNGDQILYRVDDIVFVGEDAGSDPADPISGADTATLTIEPGVTVYGDTSTDGLYVARGSQLNAVGTAEEPIVFTSGPDVRGLNDYATDTAQWLGLVINGRAPINNCNVDGAVGGTAECEDDGEASSGLYGGNAADDDSGELRYVRVQFAGIFFNEEDQSNGIAFQGVGTGTDINFVQVHNNGDDGIEFFGGTANAKNVVITGADDDSVDWTDGWTGNLQYALIEHSDVSDYGFEGDNRSDAAPNTAPRSTPQVSNFTILGAGEAVTPGARFREGMGGAFVNGVIVNTEFGIDIEQPNSTAETGGTFDLLSGATVADGATLTLESMLIDSPVPFKDDFGTEDGDDGFTAAEVEALTENVTTGDGINNLSGFSFYGKDFGVVPGTAEANVDVVDPTTFDADFFDATTFVGAVAGPDDDWYLGWTVDSTGEVTSAN